MARYRHRKLRGRKLKKQRRLIIASVIGLTFLLSTGYAAFSTNISLTAKGNIKEKEKIAAEVLTENAEEETSTKDGLYKDIYEEPLDGKYRYIYKGADPNNYIEFNDEVWRIYSIEPDESIKITRSDLLSAQQFDPIGGNGRRTTGYCSDSNAKNYGCNAWAATTNLVNKPTSFVNGSLSGAVTGDSQMLTYLNTDTSGNYYNTLSSTSKGQIVSHDWNVGPAGTWTGNESMSDLVSSTYEGKYKWNGKVGLLTKSEYIRASSNSSCVTAKYWYDNRDSTTCKGSDYLYNSSTYWWLLSPTSGVSYSVLLANTNGHVTNGTAYLSFGVRPALFLKSDIVLKGEGTSEKPYYIDES